MSLQKTWGNFHLSAMGGFYSPRFSSGAMTASRKMPRRKRPLSALLTWW